MANVIIDESSLYAIADAIREKLSVQTTYKPSEMADAIESISGGVTPTGTKQISITQNGTTTEDVTNYASAEIAVNVPNSYTQSDEGKVVSSGALVSQTSDTVTANDTYDTTLINSLTVNVSGSSKESGTIVPTSGDALTIPVSKQYSNLYVRHEDFSMDMSLSGNPFGAYAKLAVFANYDYGLVGQIISNYAGTAINGELGVIGKCGNNSSDTNEIQFSDSTITLKKLRMGGSNRSFKTGETYKWEAW